MSENELIVNEL